MAYGVITEQGDLGLGFDPVSEQEARAIQESEAQNSEEEKED